MGIQGDEDEERGLTALLCELHAREDEALALTGGGAGAERQAGLDRHRGRTGKRRPSESTCADIVTERSFA